MTLSIRYLATSIGWICFTYPDGTAKFFRTTLNPEILGEELKKSPGKGYLYDLDQLRWTNYPTDSDIVVSVSDSKPDMGELMNFVNRFI